MQSLLGDVRLLLCDSGLKGGCLISGFEREIGIPENNATSVTNALSFLTQRNLRRRLSVVVAMVALRAYVSKHCRTSGRMRLPEFLHAPAFRVSDGRGRLSTVHDWV